VIVLDLIDLALLAIKDDLENKGPSAVYKQTKNENSTTEQNRKLHFNKEFDYLAYQSGWLVGVSGEVYEITINRFTSLFILKNDEMKFDVVKISWRKGEYKPFKENYRATNVNFVTALEAGNNYIQWLKSNT